MLALCNRKGAFETRFVGHD